MVAKIIDTNTKNSTKEASAAHERKTFLGAVFLFWFKGVYSLAMSPEAKAEHRRKYAHMTQDEYVQTKCEVFFSEIEFYLNDFCEKYNIPDLSKESQSRWNAALMYIQKNVFPEKSCLKCKEPSYNSYDIDIILQILELYMSLCMLYDKEISINGFAYLTKIEVSTLYDWGYNNRLSKKCSEVFKRLVDAREETLNNKLVTGKQNPVGVITLLNHFYGYASPYTSDSARHRQSLQSNELPTLNCAKKQDNLLQDNSQDSNENCVKTDTI